MAEEIKYIPYGSDEIDYNLFITNAANEVLDYVNSKSWSRKRKESFLNAYLNLISQGITGASNDTGVWRINHAGNPIPLETLSNRDREMYGEAAYFLQQQMSNIPTKASLEKKKTEDEKKELPKFNNEYFTAKLNLKISNEEFGGSDFEKREFWELDKKGDNGIYSTDVRRSLLADKLENYMTSLEEGKYNFEGGPFSNLDDFKARANAAITALRNGTPDLLRETLRKLGLSYDDYLSDGGDEKVQLTDGRVMSQREFNQLKAEEDSKVDLEKLAKLQAALAQLKANQLDSFKSINLSKYKARPLTAKESTIEYLQNLFNRDKWSGDEASQIKQAFRLAEQNNMLVSLNREELAKLPDSWKNRGKYLRKINGIDGLYYDTLSGLYKKFYKSGATPLTTFLDVLNLNNTELKKKLADDKYWNSPIKELDSYDYANVIGALADVASIVDVEPVSAAVLAEVGTAARSYGRSKNTGFWENALYTTGDTTIGALSAIPVAGDAALGWRLGTTGLKYLGYAGLIFNAKNLPDAAAAFSKWYNYATQDGFSPVEAYKKLSRKEALDLLNGILELAGLKGAASGAIARKITKPITSNTQKVVDVDVKVNGKQTKLTITPEEAKLLRTGITGKLEKTNNKLRSTKSALEYALKNNIKVEDIEVVSAPGRIPFTRNSGMTQRTVNTEGTAKPEDFGRIWRPFARWQSKFNSNNNINSSENFWTKNFGGYKAKSNGEVPKTNSTEVPKPTETSKTKSTETPKLNKQRMNELKEKFGRSKTESSNPKLEYNLKQQHKSEKEIELFEKSYGTNNSSSKNQFGEGYGSNNNTIKNGELNVDLGNGIKFSFKVNNAADYKGNSGKVSTLRGLVAKKIKEQLHNENVDRVKVGNLLKDLKRKGWLKRGGTIENLDTEIKEILKTL